MTVTEKLDKLEETVTYLESALINIREAYNSLPDNSNDNITSARKTHLTQIEDTLYSLLQSIGSEIYDIHEEN